MRMLESRKAGWGAQHKADHRAVFQTNNDVGSASSSSGSRGSGICGPGEFGDMTEQKSVSEMHTKLWGWGWCEWERKRQSWGRAWQPRFSCSYRVGAVGGEVTLVRVRWGGEGRKGTGADDSGSTKALSRRVSFLQNLSTVHIFHRRTPSLRCTSLLGTKRQSHDQRQLQTHALQCHKAAECFHTTMTQRQRQQAVYRSMKAVPFSGDGGRGGRVLLLTSGTV